MCAPGLIVGERVGVDQVVGLGSCRRGDHHVVGLCEQLLERVAQLDLGELVRRRPTPERDHSHVEREHASRHLGTDRTHARRDRRSSPRARRATRIPQRSGASVSQVSGSRFDEREHRREHELGDRDGVRAPRAGELSVVDHVEREAVDTGAERVEPADARDRRPLDRVPLTRQHQQDLGVSRALVVERRPRLRRRRGPSCTCDTSPPPGTFTTTVAGRPHRAAHAARSRRCAPGRSGPARCSPGYPAPNARSCGRSSAGCRP